MEYVVIIIIVIVFIVKISSAIDKPKRLQQLKSNYEHHLLGDDKARALAAGRVYYSELRDGKQLTIYDEQAIANDLSTMKQ